MTNLLYFFELLIFIVPSFVLAADMREESLALEQKAMENRLKMESFEVIIDIVSGTENKIDGYDCIRFHYFVDNNKNKIRLDSTFRLTAQVPVGVEVPHEYTFIESWDDDQIYLFQKGLQLYNGVATGLALIARERTNQDTINRTIVDCRVLGLTSIGLTAAVPLNFVLLDPNRKNFSIVEESINGIPCKKISSEHPNGAVTITWIVPAQGYSVLRMRMSSADNSLVDQADYTVAEYKNSGIWFPTISEYKRMRNGNIESFQNLSVQVVSLNEPLPADIFNPKSFDVPLGKTAYTAGKKSIGKLYWDGNKIANENETVLNSIPIPSRGNAFRYFLIAAGLALISIACLFKYLELRKKK
jgi:hypothetical protein